MKISALTYDSVNWALLEKESRIIAAKNIDLKSPYAYASIVDPDLVHFSFLCEADLQTFAELTSLCSVAMTLRVVKRSGCEFIICGSLQGFINLIGKMTEDRGDEVIEFLTELYGLFRATELRRLFPDLKDQGGKFYVS